jgi:hypothetical protein
MPRLETNGTGVWLPVLSCETFRPSWAIDMVFSNIKIYRYQEVCIYFNLKNLNSEVTYVPAVLWIWNFSLRIRIRLFNEIRIRILLVKSSGFGTDLFPDEIPYDFKGPKMAFQNIIFKYT